MATSQVPLPIGTLLKKGDRVEERISMKPSCHYLEVLALEFSEVVDC